MEEGAPQPQALQQPQPAQQQQQQQAGGAEGCAGEAARCSELRELVGASGKMGFLHKLLAHCSRGGHSQRVLLFSQFASMLALLERYLRLLGYAHGSQPLAPAPAARQGGGQGGGHAEALFGLGYRYELLDGGVPLREREAAIGRFQAEEGQGQSSVFLLSTRAGGLGITLTAADTVVVYDSDW
jgi:chromodomain-helicase-DNA-binding protein 7